MESIGYEFFFDLGLIIMAAAALTFIARQLRQPALLGYILAGLMIGPFGFGLVENRAEIQALSELGVAFLLFGAAVEVNLLKLRGIGIQSVFAVLIQVPLTLLFGYMVAAMLGLTASQSIFIGIILAFSSTMVVVKVLQDMHKTHTLHARLQIALLILQDVLVILALAYVSSFFDGEPTAFTNAAIGGVGLFCIAIVLNRFAFPPLMKLVSREPEVLFVSSVAICFAFMAMAHSLGLSIVIGAFVAGIALSTFPYHMEVSGKMRSLRDFFAAIFFVSLGMQLSPSMGEPGIILALVLIAFVLFAKTAIISLIYILLGFGARVSLLTAAGVAQISEFSFIIALKGLDLKILSAELFSAITVATMATIVLTPYVVRNEYRVYELLKHLFGPLGKSPIFSIRVPEKLFDESKQEDHIVILGAHRMGRVLVSELKNQELLVVDYNPSVLDELIEEGVNCVYADAYNEETLHRLNLEKAKALISAIPDENVTLSVVHKAKEINPKLKIYVKADYAEDAVKLYDAGADLVIIPELLAGESFSNQVSQLLRNPGKTKELRKRQIELMDKQANFDVTDYYGGIKFSKRKGKKK